MRLPISGRLDLDPLADFTDFSALDDLLDLTDLLALGDLTFFKLRVVALAELVAKVIMIEAMHINFMVFLFRVLSRQDFNSSQTDGNYFCG